jgi:hypothetical protein
MATLRTSTLLLLIGLLGSNKISGQATDSLAGRALTESQIDSIVTSINSRANCYESVSRGTISKAKDGKLIGKIFTYYLSDTVTKKLFRVRNEETTNPLRKTTFYYDNDKLIRADIIIEDSTKSATPYSAKYYFSNGKLLTSSGEDKKYSNGDAILSDGRMYLERYKKPLKKEPDEYHRLQGW